MNSKMLEKQVSRLLKIPYEEQKQRLRDFARSSIEKKITIMELKQENFYPLFQNNKHMEKAIIEYSALLIAIDKYNNNLNNLDKNVIEERSKSFRQQPQNEKLLGHWAIVKTLKVDKKYSFRKIENYLKKYHKFNIAYSTIFNKWKELESHSTKDSNHE